jgi:hypothetical protein
MQITIKEIIAPQPPNEEKGWKGTKNYKIVTTDGKKLLCNPDKRPSDLDVGMVVDIETWADQFNNLYINRFKVVNDDNIAPSPQPTPTAPTPQPQAPTTNYVEEGTAGGHDVSELVGRDWAIILQACVNRDATLTADQKLKFILMNYSRGSVGAFKHLQQTEDLDNTAISEMPDDKIPF